MARPRIGRYYAIFLILSHYKRYRKKWFSVDALMRIYKGINDKDKPSWKTIQNNISYFAKEGLLQKSVFHGNLKVYVIKPEFWREVEKWAA